MNEGKLRGYRGKDRAVNTYSPERDPNVLLIQVTSFGNVKVLPSTWDRIERSKRVKGRETVVSRRRAWKTIGRLCNRAAEQAWRKGREFKVTR